MNLIQSQNLDANEALFFSRELEYLKARIYEIKYGVLKAVELIPVSFEAGPGAETIAYREFDRFGVARIIANYADDLPRADVKGELFVSRVQGIGASYGFSIQELRAAMMAGQPLEQRKANAVKQAHDTKLNSVAWFGDKAYGLQGLIYNPNITSSAAPDGNNSNTQWVPGGATADKTPDEILKDMNNLVNGIMEVTKGNEQPDTLIMPISNYTKISTTPRSATSDTTILEFFMKNNPFITELTWVNELDDLAGNGHDTVVGGADSSNIMIAYRKHPDVLTLEIPQPFEQFAAQERNLEFVVPTHARIGGVIVYKPLAIAILEGI